MRDGEFGGGGREGWAGWGLVRWDSWGGGRLWGDLFGGSLSDDLFVLRCHTRVLSLVVRLLSWIMVKKALRVAGGYARSTRLRGRTERNRWPKKA